MYVRLMEFEGQWQGICWIQMYANSFDDACLQCAYCIISSNLRRFVRHRGNSHTYLNIHLEMDVIDRAESKSKCFDL